MGSLPIDAFRRGDAEALRAVYRVYARPVATVARSVVGNDQGLVDDAVQETFLRAWRAASHFDPARELGPWLYRIARNTAIDVLRAEARPTRGAHEPEVEVAVPPESLERTWERYEVRRAVEALPGPERDVVRLGYVAGLTHPEIAQRLGIPVGTVKSRSFRAHRHLAAALGHLVAAPDDHDDPTGPGEPHDDDGRSTGRGL